MEEEEAIKVTREKLGSLLKRYRYAISHELYQGEEEHERRREEDPGIKELLAVAKAAKLDLKKSKLIAEEIQEKTQPLLKMSIQN